jgi:hypothetical protein
MQSTERKKSIIGRRTSSFVETTSNEESMNLVVCQLNLQQDTFSRE